MYAIRSYYGISNNKSKGKGNRKNGNKYLSWAFAEAAELGRRFDGKLHSGEDWINASGSTFGQPVYAIANGRVTYSVITSYSIHYTKLYDGSHSRTDGYAFHILTLRHSRLRLD